MEIWLSAIPHPAPSLFPGIRYAGRLATDPPNNLGQGEATMINGRRRQTSGTNRWGDYSMTDHRSRRWH